MTAFAQQAYQRIALETAVVGADPHRMILMLYDGLLEAVRRAAVHMQEGRVAEKGQMLGKAIRIVEEGLKASLDRASGGDLAGQLAALYDYISLRLLQANLRNDERALAEVTKLVGDLRSAWAQIEGSVAAREPARTDADGHAHQAVPPASAGSAPAVAGPRFFDGTFPQPLRRLASA